MADSTSSISWIVYIDGDGDPRYGVKTRDLISANDGDICISCLTYDILKDKKDPYIIDIGVDEGWWSFFAIDINPSVSIDAFEPNPLSVEKLRHQLASAPQISLYPCAVSDKLGTIPFILSKGQSNSRSTEATTEVPCVRLEDYIGTRHVDLIKIDTEGHDLTILRSIHHLIPQIDSIIFEFTVYWYGETRETCVSQSIEELTYLSTKYKFMFILSRREIPPQLTPIKQESIDRIVNYLYDNHNQVDIFVTNIGLDGAWT
jgi:FkbM family methyltransferase